MMGIQVSNAAITTAILSLGPHGLPGTVSVTYAPAATNQPGTTYVATGRDLVALLRRMGWPEGREMRAQWAPSPAAPPAVVAEVTAAMAQARHASAALGAQAYTMGNDNAFGAGPANHTLAHELTHVVQQKNGKI